LFDLGAAEAKLGKLTDGLANNRKALAIWEELVPADPANSWRRAWLMLSSAKVTNLLAKTGDKNAARMSCEKTEALLKTTSAVDLTNVGQKRFRAFAYFDLGEAHAILASDQTMALEERRKEWIAARNLYQNTLDMWVDMRNKNSVCKLDAGKPDELAREIARCEAGLAQK
jgi:hypothetical protein